MYAAHVAKLEKIIKNDKDINCTIYNSHTPHSEILEEFIYSDIGLRKATLQLIDSVGIENVISITEHEADSTGRLQIYVWYKGLIK